MLFRLICNRCRIVTLNDFNISKSFPFIFGMVNINRRNLHKQKSFQERKMVLEQNVEELPPCRNCRPVHRSSRSVSTAPLGVEARKWNQTQ